MRTKLHPSFIALALFVAVHSSLAAGNSATNSFAVLAKNGIIFFAGTLIDSFNSQDPNFSTNGQYIASKSSDHGNIGTIESNTVGAISCWAGTVYGQAYTGPNSTVNFPGAATATIGDTNWINGGHTGEQTTNNNLNLIIPDAPLPPTGVTYNPLPPPTNNTYVLSGSGPGTTNYYYTPSGFSLPGNYGMIITNGAFVLVATNFAILGSPGLNVATNTSLKLYLGGILTQFVVNGIVNSNGAQNVTIYGANSLTQIKFYNSAFVGTIYAPYATISLAFGSSIIGAVVCYSNSFSSSSSLHYDEALGNSPLIFAPPQSFTAQNPGTGLQLQLAGTPNYPYILQMATNLTPPVNWQSILTNPADVNGNWSWTITNLSAFPASFYRAAAQ